MFTPLFDGKFGFFDRFTVEKWPIFRNDRISNVYIDPFDSSEREAPSGCPKGPGSYVARRPFEKIGHRRTPQDRSERAGTPPPLPDQWLQNGHYGSII